MRSRAAARKSHPSVARVLLPKFSHYPSLNGRSSLFMSKFRLRGRVVRFRDPTFSYFDADRLTDKHSIRRAGIASHGENYIEYNTSKWKTSTPTSLRTPNERDI